MTPSADLELFRKLFCLVNHAFVAENPGGPLLGNLTAAPTCKPNVKRFVGKSTEKLLSDDLLESHFAGVSRVGAYSILKDRSDQVVISVHPPDTSIVKSVVSKFNVLGYPSYI
jgi:hypothetical protein